MSDANAHIEALLRVAVGRSSACSLSEKDVAALHDAGRLKEHAASCPACAERGSIMARVVEDPVVAHPAARARMVARAQALLSEQLERPQREDLLTLVVRWVKGAFEVLTGGDALVPTPALALRSGAQGAAAEEAVAEPVSFHRSLGGLDLVLHLAPRSDERFDILLDPPGGSSHRYALMRGGKELFSEVSRGTRVRFPEVGPGTYAIAVHTGPRLIGRIALTVRH